jgi:hypothetical protein
MSVETIVRRVAKVPFSRLGDELLALDGDSGYLCALNESGGRVWDLIEEPIAVGKVCAQMQREYLVDGATCEAAVILLLEALEDAGLVETV